MKTATVWIVVFILVALAHGVLWASAIAGLGYAAVSLLASEPPTDPGSGR